MDLENGLLHAALGDADLFAQLSALHISPRDIDSTDLRRAYEFIIKYESDQNAIPTVAAVNDMCRVELKDQGVTGSFLLTELMQRQAFRRVNETVEAAQLQLRDNDPDGAFNRLRDLVEDDHGPKFVQPTTIFSHGQEVVDLYEKVKGGYTGVPLPWPTLTRTTLGMWPKTSTYFIARPGVGKCVRGDTLVMDAGTGVYKTAAQIVADRSDVLTRREDGVIERVTPSAWLNTGRKECFRVLLRSGRELSGTPEHPVMTVDGWKRLDEVKAGDHLETVRRVPEPTHSIAPPNSEVLMLAALLAEGGYTQGQVTFTNQDPKIVAVVDECAVKLGAEMIQYPYKEDFEYSFRWGGGRQEGPNPVRFLLDSYGCGHEKSIEKRIPDRVFGYSNETLAKFLGMFWSCDGSVPKGQWAEVGLGSKVMVDQIQRLLLRFGITSRVRYKRVRVGGCLDLGGKEFDSWTLRIHATSNGIFRDKIPLIGEKVGISARLKDPQNPNVDNVPMTPGLKAKILKAVEQGQARGVKFTELAGVLGMESYLDRSKLVRRRSISRRLLSAFIEVFGADDLKQYLVNHWDEVVDVVWDGEQDVYDLSVAGTHSFVAEDIVVHNTQVAVLAGRHAWKEPNNRRVLIISPEMSKMEIAERFFVVEANVSANNVLAGTLSDFEFARLKDKVKAMEDLENLWIMDMDNDLSPVGMEAVIRHCKPDLVAIDSIYMLDFRGDRAERTIRAVDWIRRTAKRFDTATLGFHQLSREAVKGKKSGGVGYEDGAIALTDQLFWDAQAVYIMEQDKDMRDDNRLKIHTSKVRRGKRPTKPLEIHWDFDSMKFDEIDTPGEEFEDKEYKPDNEIPF